MKNTNINTIVLKLAGDRTTCTDKNIIKVPATMLVCVGSLDSPFPFSKRRGKLDSLSRREYWKNNIVFCGILLEE